MVIVDSDGAAALVLVSGAKARELGLEVIAKIKGYADAAQVTNLKERKSFSWQKKKKAEDASNKYRPAIKRISVFFGPFSLKVRSLD